MNQRFASIKKHWIFILVGVIALTFLPSFFVGKKTQPTPSPTPIGTSSTFYQDIRPGITSESQLSQILGTPLNKTPEVNKTILDFPSDYPSNPHQAVTRKGQTILFIEKVSLDKNQALSEYISRYGQPDTIKYAKEIGPKYSLHIFLKHGLAVAAHDIDEKVVEIWYFQPQNLKDFLDLSPINLLNQPITTFAP